MQMGIPTLPKRLVLHGAVISFVVLFVILGLPLERSEERVVEVKKVLDLTKDIFINPFLENKEIWKVNLATVFTGEREWAQTESVENIDALETLLENTILVGKETNPVMVTALAVPGMPIRPETITVDVKSEAEKQLTRAAASKSFTHIVKEGETIWDISRTYGIDVQTIIGANLEQTNLGKLKVGQEIRILNTKGVIHKITDFETISDVAGLYKVTSKSIVDYNGVKASRIKPGDLLVVPGANPTSLECRGGYSEGYIWPAKGPISSGYGARWGKIHYGLDIVIKENTPVKAARSGKVIFSGEASGYGYAIYIKHDDNTVTRYGHNNKLLVKKDEFVYQGETIALSGNTGTSTGPHLHFEIRIKNKAVDPKAYLK